MHKTIVTSKMARPLQPQTNKSAQGWSGGWEYGPLPIGNKEINELLVPQGKASTLQY